MILFLAIYEFILGLVFGFSLGRNISNQKIIELEKQILEMKNYFKEE